MKYKIVFYTISILLIIVIIILLISNEKVLTGRPINIDKIILIKNDPNQKNYVTIITQKDILNTVEIIQKSKKIKTVRYPNHTEGISNDSEYIIEIVYQDNKKDSFRFSERKDYFYRLLNTKGSSGDFGYIILENDLIYDYCQHYFATQVTKGDETKGSKHKACQGDGSLDNTSGV